MGQLGKRKMLYHFSVSSLRSKALGGKFCSDQVWLTKSQVSGAVALCEITVVALTHKVAHAKSSVKNTGDHQP